METRVGPNASAVDCSTSTAQPTRVGAYAANNSSPLAAYDAAPDVAGERSVYVRIAAQRRNTSRDSFIGVKDDRAIRVDHGNSGMPVGPHAA